MIIAASSYNQLPQKPGVYQFLDKDGNILYVGKAKQLKNRVSSYFTQQHQLAPRTKIMVEQVKKIKIIIVESEIESLLLEANLIKKKSPKYNVMLTDGKAYPLIRITTKHMFPAVLVARRSEDKDSLYFGPFPSTAAMRTVLRILRRIFPFHSTLNHPPKPCLYFHLHLCPCVPAFNTEENRNAYKKTIKHVITFLQGKTKQVTKDLTTEQKEAVKKEFFEHAQELQRQLDAISYVTNPVHTPFEYETNPNLRVDLRQQEMQNLQKILLQNGISIQLPKRIECYDISNIQGANPTASMVVLTNGEIDKSQYRKFKIKTKGPNDFAMMAEVLTRRLKHSEWPMPDLFVVDGGKGQISAAKEILQHFSNPPLIGLAKREETLITSDFTEIKLSKRTQALQLIMRIRDEAHRFAITYHRKLRSRATFE